MSERRRVGNRRGESNSGAKQSGEPAFGDAVFAPFPKRVPMVDEGAFDLSDVNFADEEQSRIRRISQVEQEARIARDAAIQAGASLTPAEAIVQWALTTKAGNTRQLKPKKKYSPPSMATMMAKARALMARQSEEGMGVWATASVTELIGLHHVLMSEVYDLELPAYDTQERACMVSRLTRGLKTYFDGSVAAFVGYMQWAWAKEQWKKTNNKLGAPLQLMWLLQGDMVTRYRFDARLGRA